MEKLKPFLPLRGKYQVISYAGMNHALHASKFMSSVMVYIMYIRNCMVIIVWQAATNSVTL